MSVRLPSRYEDLDLAFRGRLRPNRPLLEVVQRAARAMEISGGIRFLPVFGESGSGKSCAARELGTHLPECEVVELSREAIVSEASLLQEIRAVAGRRRGVPKLIVAVVDQYEENVAEASAIPTQFVERLSLLDRGALRDTRVLFIWLTTSRSFQEQLEAATSRNARILAERGFALDGPDFDDWADIVEETFAFHNREQPLADYEILRGDIEQVATDCSTIGLTIERVGELLGTFTSGLHDLSRYQVVMLWPVTDGLRIERIQGFTSARDGYKLDWIAFYRQLNVEDREQLPLAAFNRARLYFDVRLVPIAAADLKPLCRNLEDDDIELNRSYLDRFQSSHFSLLAREAWDPSTYAPMRERDSRRAREARDWYPTVTASPVLLGRRIAKILRELGMDAQHEQDVSTQHGRVRADILVRRPGSQQDTLIVELKAFAPDGTMPSTIRDSIRTTLRRHAQLAGFLPRQ